MAHLGVVVGQIAEGSAKCIGELAKQGVVDPHKDAVAYAAKQKADVLRVRTPGETEELETARAAVSVAEKALADEPDAKKKEYLAKALKVAQDLLADLA
jgi:hypothetical protein